MPADVMFLIVGALIANPEHKRMTADISFWLFVSNYRISMQVRETADHRTEGVVAQDGGQKEGRLQEAGSGARGGGECHQRAYHCAGSRQILPFAHQDVLFQQLRGQEFCGHRH